MRCKCRYCQTNLNTQEAYKITENNKVAYFCNEEHYNYFIEKEKREKLNKEEIKRKQKEELEAIKKQKKEEEAAIRKQKKEEEAARRQQKKEEEALAIEKRKQEKDKAYYLICEIIGRKEIINTVLWKEWASWNKVADNDKIGSYLEENRTYLCGVISRLKDKELDRIRYLSAILKNNLGDFKQKAKEIEKPKVKVDESFYESSPVAARNRRRSLADLEDEI